ncbi:hypothetical protein SRHO_G00100200 [Serrasalmus rhombeus]
MLLTSGSDGVAVNVIPKGDAQDLPQASHLGSLEFFQVHVVDGVRRVDVAEGKDGVPRFLRCSSRDVGVVYGSPHSARVQTISACAVVSVPRWLLAVDMLLTSGSDGVAVNVIPKGDAKDLPQASGKFGLGSWGVFSSPCWHNVSEANAGAARPVPARLLATPFS